MTLLISYVMMVLIQSTYSYGEYADVTYYVLVQWRYYMISGGALKRLLSMRYLQILGLLGIWSLGQNERILVVFLSPVPLAGIESTLATLEHHRTTEI